MQEIRKCDICKRPCGEFQYLCREHVLLKEAAYGVNDIKLQKEGFQEKAIERLLKYVIYKMREEYYEYPPTLFEESSWYRD